MGCWAADEAPTPLSARPQAPLALRAAEFGHIMKRKLSALAGRDLAASSRSLKKGIAQRKTVEAALKQSQERYQSLLDESLSLQKHLRRLTHQLLMAQEAERMKLSHDLRDEIAQTLLGISVRLLTLKKGAKGDKANLKKDIAKTQRLVQESVRSINQFARELDIRQQA